LEKTLVIVKPDGVQRGLVGEIIGRVERRGMQMAAIKMVHVSRQLAEAHYSIHKGKPFYDGLIDYITSSPVVVMIWKGNKAVEVIRQVLGDTNPTQAAPGTLRADLAIDIGRNLAHGSDSPQNAETEIGLWFTSDELVTWKRATEIWVYDT
jgi:nucleoside-diphosphate kinase